MKTFLVGVVIGIFVVPLGVWAYFLSGMAPVATAAPPLPFERVLANGALHATIAKQKPANAPITADESTYLAGAQIYIDNCQVCHGTAGGEQTAIAKGMFPKPPNLIHGKGVTDDEPGETYWKAANGIRLTGMPAFNRALSETQLWQVTLLLANADKLPDSVKQTLTAPRIVPPTSPVPLAPTR